MIFLLTIDTTQEQAHVRLTGNGQLLNASTQLIQKDHASWIHSAIKNLLATQNILVTQLSAIAVAEGPGSYTGLRVGMATAKGLCYAAKIPLITMNSLQILAGSVLTRWGQSPDNFFICPMIDARRMEVFTAVYQQDLLPVMAPQPLILEDHSYATHLDQHTVLFCGSGASKWQQKCSHPNAAFFTEAVEPTYMDYWSHQKFISEDFANLAYAEPVYLKEFYTHPS